MTDIAHQTDLKKMANLDITKLLEDCSSLRPPTLILDDLRWKYLVRSVLRGKNVMMVGPARCGKTISAKSVASALNRPFFIFNCGSCQDARIALIGNTVFRKDTGTVFCASEFVRAIQTINAIILLDELSRISHDGTNILMPVLDPTQRTLRLDESDQNSVIHVADGVTFIATANIGNEYTATRQMDKAMTLRFPTTIEMQLLNEEQEMGLLEKMYPESNEDQRILYRRICKIAEHTRLQVKKAESRLESFIPTGTVVECAELVNDGFSLRDIAEMVIYPNYSEEGGVESQRTYIKQLVQKYLDQESAKNKNPMTDPEEVPGEEDTEEVPF
jgi:MoxR-like ATPase